MEDDFAISSQPFLYYTGRMMKEGMKYAIKRWGRLEKEICGKKKDVAKDDW